MDQFSEAAYNLLTIAAGDLRGAVTGLSVAQLNGIPCADTSSLAVLVAHATTSTRALLTAAVTGRRDRERYRTEERVPAFAIRDADEARLMALLDQLDAAIGRLPADAPADSYAGTIAETGGDGGPPTSRAQTLILAVAHLREHVGHAQLTRQLIDAGVLAPG
ncbi:MAG: DinB family protein [Dehalococcoidia bacterium]